MRFESYKNDDALYIRLFMGSWQLKRTMYPMVWQQTLRKQTVNNSLFYMI